MMARTAPATQIAQAELLLDLRMQLGEGVTWCERSQALFWTDIEGSALFRLTAGAAQPQRWALPERLGSFALCETPDRLLLGLSKRLAFFDLRDASLQDIVAVEPDLPTRVNDGRCDRQGRFVFGTMDDRPQRDRIGSFYRLNRDLTLERLPLGAVRIPNSIGFAPESALEGGRMYYCDTLTRTIRVCAYGADGVIAGDREFVALTDADGDPDGSTVDAEGGLWNAHWGGRRIVRYDADGRETARIAVPTAQPSCVAFGGAALDTLYITSARVDLSEQALRDDPHAGGVFRVRPGMRGMAEPRFGGSAAVPPATD